MALKKCKDCGKEVSDQAGKCPHCGAPVQAGGVYAMAILIAFFFVLIMIGVALR
ncbi:MAG: zinc-ribbon domain-containing protein [Smithella sp.]